VVGVVARDDLAFRLVIEDHPRQAVGEAQLDELAIDLDPVARADRLSDLRRLAIDVDATGGDQRFHLPARPDATVGEQLVQALGLAGRFLVAAAPRRLAGRRAGLRAGAFGRGGSVRRTPSPGRGGGRGGREGAAGGRRVLLGISEVQGYR
jgi:hypothetical protein